MKFFNRDANGNVITVLRLGVGAVFFLFGVDKFVHVQNWMGYLPSFVNHLPYISAATFLQMTAVFEIVTGILLIAGVAVLPVAALAGLYILSIVFVMGANEITIRDNALIGLCLALVIDANGRRKRPILPQVISLLPCAYVVLILGFGVQYLRGA